MGEGAGVTIMIFFRGREMAHQEIGFELMGRITAALAENAVVESKPVMAGRNLSVTVRSK